MIQEQLQPEKITLIEFDTEIHSVIEITQEIRINDIEFNGGGGTDVTPVFEWAIQNTPEVLVIFTDGDFRMPKLKVPSDIIWIIHDNAHWTANNGKVFHYKLV
jgi:predicted metal-dependent peptidase